MGGKGAGKDTLANYLVTQRNFVRIAFADALYQEVSKAFNVSIDFLQNRDTKELPLPEMALDRCRDNNFTHCLAEELGIVSILPTSQLFTELTKPRSPRQIMQWWGTEYRRKSKLYGKDSYWLDQVMDVIAKPPTTNFVVTHVRFSNEADLIESFVELCSQSGIILTKGELWRVTRRSIDDAAAARRLSGDPTALHPSEVELLTRPALFVADNVDGNPDSLQEAIKSYFSD
jgi:hypothetical protein